jgi:hypothetical protein
MENPRNIPEEIVHLVLAIDQHSPGYVDGYYGPPEWRAQAAAEAAGLPALRRRADELAAAIALAPGLDEQRRDYLAHEARCAQTTLRMLAGEPLALVDEVAGVYGLQIAWTDESFFEQQRRALDELLPGQGELAQRYAAFEDRLEVAPERVEPLARYALEALRRRTEALIAAFGEGLDGLPPGDQVELIMPDADEPWAGYHEYLGEQRSRVAINRHFPQYLSNFINILAHEAYPGHHTEHSLKEKRWTKDAGRIEHCLVMANSPSCVLSEGAAMCALDTAFPADELAGWFEQEIYPRAGIKGIEAARQLEIARCARRIERLFGNAVMLLYDQQAGDEAVYAYMRRWSPERDENLRAMLDFMKDPLRRSYTFCYAEGTKLIEELFAARSPRATWHLRAISEPATPSQVRAWVAD